jgi:3-methylfumaryl-CoA hydratase
LWLWLYFLPAAPRSQVGLDGHPMRGGFLPPVELPRRMWAGGRLSFVQPVFANQPMRRHSRVEAVFPKQGRSGALVFVKLLHDIHAGETLAIREEQDIVYRDPPQPGAPAPAPAMA